MGVMLVFGKRFFGYESGIQRPWKAAVHGAMQ
jgi:predicted phosphohydrolase